VRQGEVVARYIGAVVLSMLVFILICVAFFVTLADMFILETRGAGKQLRQHADGLLVTLGDQMLLAVVSDAVKELYDYMIE